MGNQRPTNRRLAGVPRGPIPGVNMPVPVIGGGPGASAGVAVDPEQMERLLLGQRRAAAMGLAVQSYQGLAVADSALIERARRIEAFINLDDEDQDDAPDDTPEPVDKSVKFTDIAANP